MATNFSAKVGEIGLFTFIRSPDIPKRIAISPFWFQKKLSDMIWLYYVYIWWTWSSNSGV